MDDQLTDFLEWIQLLTPFWAYLVLILIAYGENVLPPVPGDLAVVFGGYLAGIGHLNYLTVVALSTVGGALGFMTMFWLGHRFGDAALDPDRLRWLPKTKIYRARLWLLKWGYAIVGLNRFLSGLRSIISLTVGAAQMNVWKTALFATLSALVWTSLIAYLGAVVGENWEVVLELLTTYGRVVAVLISLAVAAKVVHVVWRRSRAANEDTPSPDSPGINSPRR